MDNQIRICLICDGYPPERKVGGIEIFTQTLARGLVQRGHFVSVIGFSSNVDQIRYENDSGVRVIRIPYTPRGIIPRMFSDRLHLDSVIRKEIKDSNLNHTDTNFSPC